MANDKLAFGNIFEGDDIKPEVKDKITSLLNDVVDRKVQARLAEEKEERWGGIVDAGDEELDSLSHWKIEDGKIITKGLTTDQIAAIKKHMENPSEEPAGVTVNGKKFQVASTTEPSPYQAHSFFGEEKEDDDDEKQEEEYSQNPDNKENNVLKIGRAHV